MEGFLVLQLICIGFPALLALLVWGAITVVSPTQSKFALRFDLTTIMILMVVIGVILMLTKAAEESLIRDYERLMVCFVSVFALPLVWLIQITLDDFRDQRRKREARKTEQKEINLPDKQPENDD
jgi:ABC-type transport system involved in cytochrome bd biosynthesis fused ATPase/permease subunit